MEDHDEQAPSQGDEEHDGAEMAHGEPGSTDGASEGDGAWAPFTIAEAFDKTAEHVGRLLENSTLVIEDDEDGEPANLHDTVASWLIDRFEQYKEKGDISDEDADFIIGAIASAIGFTSLAGELFEAHKKTTGREEIVPGDILAVVIEPIIDEAEK